MKNFKIIFVSTFILANTLSFSNLSYSQNHTPEAIYNWCSGVLSRSSGLIKQNMGKFSGGARSTMNQLYSHLSNNGMILMQKAAVSGKQSAKNAADSINNGIRYANQHVGNNVLIITTKGSKANKTIMNCLSLNK